MTDIMNNNDTIEKLKVLYVGNDQQLISQLTLNENFELISKENGLLAINFLTNNQFKVFKENVNAPQLIIAPELQGFINTVSRENIDSAVTDIIGNTKIPPIEYADVVATLVERTKTVDEEGIFRFAPGAPRG
jgi:hypothetical protein